MPTACTYVYLIKSWYNCNKYSCFVLRNTIIVRLLRHKTSVETLQFKLRSQFKTCLLRPKIRANLRQKNSGVVKTCTKISNTRSIFNAIISPKSKPNFLSLKLYVRKGYGTENNTVFSHRTVVYQKTPYINPTELDSLKSSHNRNCAAGQNEFFARN